MNFVKEYKTFLPWLKILKNWWLILKMNLMDVPQFSSLMMFLCINLKNKYIFILQILNKSPLKFYNVYLVWF